MFFVAGCGCRNNQAILNLDTDTVTMIENADDYISDVEVEKYILDDSHDPVIVIFFCNSEMPYGINVVEMKNYRQIFTTLLPEKYAPQKVVTATENKRADLEGAYQASADEDKAVFDDDVRRFGNKINLVMAKNAMRQKGAQSISNLGGSMASSLNSSGIGDK